MSCCGSKRMAPAATAAPPASSSEGVAQSAPAFQYAGYTALTVRGPITGRIYHFATAGAVQVVDPRDAPSLAAVPHLRRTYHARQSF